MKDASGEKQEQKNMPKVRESTLEVRDRVLVKNVGIRGTHKIADRWSETVYKVVKQIGESPVYVVASEKSGSPERTLHRDLLLPCGFLASTIQSEVDQEKENQSKKVPRGSDVSEVEEEQQLCETDEEVEYYSSQSTPDNVYPTIIVVRDIPQADVVPSSDDNKELSRERSSLNAQAEIFKPTEMLEKEDPVEERDEDLPDDGNPEVDVLPVGERCRIYNAGI